MCVCVCVCDRQRERERERERGGGGGRGGEVRKNRGTGIDRIEVRVYYKFDAALGVRSAGDWRKNYIKNRGKGTSKESQ